MIKFIRTSSDNVHFQGLIKRLDVVLKEVDGDQFDFLSQFNKVDKINNVVVCFVDEVAVGCGAFKEYESGVAEIKRMFVSDEFRGKGIASAILLELETWAKEEGYSKCILDTNKDLKNAVQLYLKNGYEITERYGQYIDVASSVCMKKELN